MKIGFALPQFGRQAHTGSGVARFAREVEAAGAQSLWASDRPLAAGGPHIGRDDDAAIPRHFNAILDPFALLALAAGVTERVRLGTNVIVAPSYPTSALANQLLTLDILSAGRLTAGFGIGRSPEENQPVGVPFPEGDACLDETLDALEAIRTAGPVGYQGRPPIHLAGRTPRSLARIGRRADGWLPVLMIPGPPGQYGYLLEQREAVVRAAAAADRDPAAIETTVRVNAAIGTPLQDIADAVYLLSDRTLFDTVVIDLLYVADTANDAREAALQLLKLLG